MLNYISLKEASDYLGVSRNTLRNWDTSGKLVADRNPANGYRRYSFEDIVQMKAVMDGTASDRLAEDDGGVLDAASNGKGSARAVRSIVNKLHGIIRDSGAFSDIMERFDEISKLLFMRLFEGDLFKAVVGAYVETDVCAEKMRARYVALLNQCGINSHDRFSSILLDNECLVKCANLLAEADLRAAGPDIKGFAYEEVIRGTFDKNDNQQFFTPPLIVEYMVSMLGDCLSGTICDPACGTSGFLVAASKARKDGRFIGFEIDPRLAWVSRLNLCLHDVEHGEIGLMGDGGALGPGMEDYYSSVDVILTNPPFGSDYSDQNLLSRFVLGRGKKSRRRGILFIEQAWNLLKDGGVVSIIIDQGVLNSSSAKDVRDYIVEHFMILAIIDLPDTAFMPYASVSTSILFLEKKGSSNRRKKAVTFFARAHHIGRKPNGDDDYLYDEYGNASLNNDLDMILEAWREYQSNGMIKEGLDIYISDLESEGFDNPETRLDFAFHHPMRLRSFTNIMSSRFPLVELGELCTERNESYLPSADPDASTIMLTGLANIEPKNGRAVQVRTAAASIKSGVKRYELNDILFAKMRPSLRKVAHVPFGAGGYASSECAVFTVKRDEEGAYIIDPSLLAVILRSDFVYGQLVHLVQGSGRPRISNKNLRKIKIPVPPRRDQENCVSRIKLQTKMVERMKSDAAALLREASELEEATVNECVEDILGGLND